MATYPASGSAAGIRTVCSVLNYGADATGTGDSTAAFLRAIAAADNAAQSGRSAVLMPQGSYKITDTLPWNSSIYFWGQGPGTKIYAGNSGMAAKYIFGAQGNVAFPTIFNGFAMYNTFAVTSAGGCIAPSNIVDMTIQDCFFQTAGDCIHADINKVFVLNVENCTFRGIPIGGNPYPFGGRGIACYTSGGTIFGCDFSLLETGILISGAGCTILGNRAESNWVGVKFGVGVNGDTYGMINGAIKGMQFEANGTAVDCGNSSGCSFENFAANGELQGPLGGINSQYGIIAAGAGNSYRNVVADGDYVHSAWSMRGGPAVIENCSASNNQNAPGFDLMCPVSDLTFVGKGMVDASNPSSLPVKWRSGPTRALSQYTALTSMVQGTNLSGRSAVGAAASNVDITFLVGLASQDMIQTVTPAAGGSLVPFVTYYYTGTIINELGEMGGHTEHVQAMGSGQTQNTILTYGIIAPGPANTTYKRRVYRGLAPGVYDGYYEQTGVNQTFVDTGAPFTGLKSPPLGANNLPSGAEPDTNYSVVGVETDWDAGGWWISSKATTGFRINFHTAAPGGGGNVGWLIAR